MLNNINGYSNVSNPYQKTVKNEQSIDNKVNVDTIAKETTEVTEDVAATYEKSSDKEVTSTPKESNADIVARLKADTEMRTSQLRSLVEKMFNKQGITFNNSSDIYAVLRSGNFTVDPEVAAQAKKDIAEDGYWGVKQTSDRMVDFAMALSNNDPEKADKMIAAVKKGYEQATKTWGGELPDICKQTLDTTIKRLEEWRDGLTSNTEKIEDASPVE